MNTVVNEYAIPKEVDCDIKKFKRQGSKKVEFLYSSKVFVFNIK